VRHGLMLVGQPFSGKSSSLHRLAGALTQLSDAGVQGTLFNKIQIRTINPKSVTMGQLYGKCFVCRPAGCIGVWHYSSCGTFLLQLQHELMVVRCRSIPDCKHAAIATTALHGCDLVHALHSLLLQARVTRPPRSGRMVSWLLPSAAWPPTLALTGSGWCWMGQWMRSGGCSHHKILAAGAAAGTRHDTQHVWVQELMIAVPMAAKAARLAPC
jgi:hypothetical protein